MTRTSCVRCEGEFFEVQQLKPQGHNSTGLMVQCSKCGAPVTFLDAHVKDVGPEPLDEVVEEIKRTVVESPTDSPTSHNASAAGCPVMTRYVPDALQRLEAESSSP